MIEIDKLQPLHVAREGAFKMQKNELMPSRSAELMGLEDHIKVSIDRLTIVADYKEASLDKDLREWLQKPFIELSGEGVQVIDDSRCYFDDFGHRHGYMAPEQVAFIHSPRYLKDAIRIDFNPNHGMLSEGGKWLRALIARLPNKHFSRCDVAFDIFNLDQVKMYQFWQFGITKKVFYGMDGEIETTYYGSSASEKQVRIYNKKKEQEARHGVLANVDSWWRFELQLRGSKAKNYPAIVKEALEKFYFPDYRSLPNPSQQAMVLSMMVDQTIYANASKNTKQRWRDLLRSCTHQNEISQAMARIFVRDFDKLEGELQAIMNKFHIEAEEVDDEV